MKDVTVLHVRKQIQDNGNPRYRYSIGRKDLTIKELTKKKGFKFKYGISMLPQDIKTVESTWSTKLVK